MLPDDRVFVLRHRLEHRQIFVGADVAQHEARAALQHSAPGALDGGALARHGVVRRRPHQDLVGQRVRAAPLMRPGEHRARRERRQHDVACESRGPRAHSIGRVAGKPF